MKKMKREGVMCYLAILGIAGLWVDRSEVVLACLGALLTLLGYGPSDKKEAGNSPSS